MLAKIKAFFTKKVIISVVLIVGIGGSIFTYVRLTAEGPVIETAVVTKRDLQQEVDVTGHVQPTEEVQLAFETGGKIVTVNGDVGDTVAYGQILALIDSSEVSASLSSVRASAASAQSVLKEYQLALQSEQAKLDELRLGTRPEEIAVAQTRVISAEQSLQDAKDNLAAVRSTGQQDLANEYLNSNVVLNEAYTKADDALVKYTDHLFSDSFATKNQLDFIVNPQSIAATVEESRGRAYSAVDAFGARLLTIGTGQSEMDTFLSEALGYLTTVQQFLNDLNIALQNSVSVDAATLTAYKADVSAARSGVVSASTSISKQIQAISGMRVSISQNEISAQNRINDAVNALAVAQSELSLSQSGSSPEQIRAQEARVSQAETVVETQRARVNQAWAEVQRVSAQLGNYVLRAPFAGIITKQDASVGEIVGANVKLITVISLANFEVVANVPEADIAKIQVADRAELTLDAYSDDVKFEAMVSEIDPAQTTIEGVTTYKVTLQFAEDDDRIRSGMTANVIIDTERRDQALSIPQRAVITRNGDRFVRVPDVDPSAAPIERTITVGLASSDGYIEVLSGLSEGETVIVSIRD